MTEKRFTFDSEFEMGIYDRKTNKSYDGRIGHQKRLCELLEGLYEENQRLKQYTKQILQNHLDGWRGVYNPIDESLVIEINVVKSIAEDLGVDLE